MDSISREVFRAIHEGKWLKIEYKNRAGSTTNYWGGIENFNPDRGTLSIYGLHLMSYTLEKLTIYMTSIISAEIVDGTYCEVNHSLVKDIAENRDKYEKFFGNIANLKILNYLEECNRLDTTPYHSEYALIKYLDLEQIVRKQYQLSDEQFAQIVRNFQRRMDKKKEKLSGRMDIQILAMNVLSIHTKKGLYVLAYKKLNLDVKNRCLRPEKDITVCREFQLDATTKESIRKFLDAEDYELLADFEGNQEKIKDCISKRSNDVKVDDIPYVIGLGMDVILDLHSEYEAIVDSFEKGKVTIPMQAFFGNLLDKPRRLKAYPITLVNNRINIDQLLAINNAMKYPTAYIQGPPGTGKTNTIINTIVTAFFNERTVLFSSYNNHPLDGVFDKLTSLKYRNRTIPFPVLRLGNAEKIREAIAYINSLRSMVATISVFEKQLDKRKEERAERAKRLSQVLKQYENLLDLKEREETLHRVLEYQEEHPGASTLIPFTADLGGRQLDQVRDEMKKREGINEEAALSLLDTDRETFLEYLYYTSAKYIKKLDEDKYQDFRYILDLADWEDQQNHFNKYISKSENIKKLQKVFPIIITTCLSSHRLGEPEPLFDMVIIDEASQCNTAVSLVPILRGENLMLVGDPQQLNPVILLDPAVNQYLRKKYQVSDEYDYIENSIYKTFLASDSVSDEILLHNHYRCNKKIIGFNNKKYYNSQLCVKTESFEKNPLVFVDVKTSKNNIKNSSSEEVNQILSYIKANRDKTIGVITPFVNQRALLEQELKNEGIVDVACGTVHTFQGDEKDIVLFSTAIGEGTGEATYQWLSNNRELINVATSRAREKLIILGDMANIERLHTSEEDDLYELIQYVRENGQSVVTQKQSNSRALGVKPFSTETEEAFLMSLTHALENIWLTQSRFSVQKEVAISQVFQDDYNYDNLFYTGRFDFVVYERMGNDNIPILAIELDGKEHYEDEVVKIRDQRKNAICRSHNLQLIRVENVYARRYNYIKSILMEYFRVKH